MKKGYKMFLYFWNMNLRIFVLIFIFLFSCSNENEKNEFVLQEIQNLHKKARNAGKDSLSNYVERTNELIKKLSNVPDSLSAKNAYLKGKYYFALKKDDSAIVYYKEAISYTKRDMLNEEEKLYYKNLAYAYKLKGDYLNSLSILNQLETKIDGRSDYQNLAEINTQKQSIYKLLKDYKKSLVYNKKAITYFALAKDTSKLVNSLLLRSSLNYYNFKNKKEAYRLLDSILTIDINSSEYRSILKNQTYQNYGIFKYYDGDYLASYKNYETALGYLRTPKTYGDSLELANSYANIAEVCLDLKKFKEAEKYNDSVDKYTAVLNANLRNFHLQNKLRHSYEIKSDFKEVSRNLSAVNANMNKNYQDRMTKELSALREANEKEKELLIANQKVSLDNSKLRQKQILLFSVVGFLVLLTLIVILFYRQKKLAHEKEEVFMQQRLFRAQMNPHFTSNILYTIQDLIQENKEKANKYLITFSRLLRLNLENSMDNFTLLEKEVEVLTKYLELQQLRFPNKFDYQININDLDDDLISIPPMLIQPFVENAIEHGFKDIDHKGTIQIDISFKNDLIFCQITDNGSGLKKEVKKEGHNSASTLLIKQLIKKLIGEEVSIRNNEKEKGTTVQFYMPFKEL